MNSILSFFIKQAHWIIILNSFWGFYNDYTAHEEAVEREKGKIDVIKNKIKRKERDLELLESFKRDLENSKRKVESVASQIEKVQRQLPNSISDPEILDVFHSEAKLVNIKRIGLNPKDEKNHGFYYSKRYGFQGTGTFLQFLVFFERLSNRERILNISRLEVKNSEGKQKGRFQLVDMNAELEAYRYNKDYREDSGIRAIESKFKGGKGRKR